MSTNMTDPSLVAGATMITSEQGQQMAENARAEVESSITVAIKFPRNEDDAYGKMIAAAQRPTFQEKAVYRYPRGDTEVIGPSINLAREFARVWGNMRLGVEVVSQTDDNCHIRGYAWDMQTNTKITSDARFKLLIYRKHAHGRNKPGWIKPDEREARELINKHGSIALRNCILSLIPRDMVEDIQRIVLHNQKEGIANDLEESRKDIVAAFAPLNIAASQLESYLGHPISESTADELVALRGVYRSIKDGNSVWSDYVPSNEDDKPKKGTSVAEMVKKAKARKAKPKEEPKGEDEAPKGKSPKPQGQEPWEALADEFGDLADEDKPAFLDNAKAQLEPDVYRSFLKEIGLDE